MQENYADEQLSIKEYITFLYRMTSRELISSRKEHIVGKRYRQYYHIEEAGKEYLKYGEAQARLIFTDFFKLFDD